MKTGPLIRALKILPACVLFLTLKVVVPADEAETTAVIKWAADYEGPVYVRLGRAGVDDVTPEGYEFTPGESC